MPCQVSKYSKGTRDKDRRKNGQPIQAVGEINSITGSNDDQIGEYDVKQAHGYGYILEKGNNQGCLNLGSGIIKNNSRSQTNDRLPEIFPTGRQTSRIIVDQLFVIIDPAYEAKTKGCQ